MDAESFIMGPTDPHDIMRAVWASSNILPDPDDPRQWETLPEDAMSHVLGCLNRQSLAAVRLSCRSWSSSVNKSVVSLQLSCWPPTVSFLSTFTSLTSVNLAGLPSPGSSTADAPRASSSSSSSSSSGGGGSSLLSVLAQLPKLANLSMSFADSACLHELQHLTGLTHLALSKSGAAAGAALAAWARDGGEEAAAAAAAAGAQAAAAAAAGVAGGAEAADGPGLMPGDEGDWLLPGGVAVAGQAEALPGTAAAGAGAGAGAVAPGSGSPPPPRSCLPPSLSQLCRLASLTLEHVTPDFKVLGNLSQLKRLELVGQTLASSRSGLLVAANPLVGLCLLGSQLTALVARCNYGINRLPSMDIAAMQQLQHLDVSKNMLWALPDQVSRLVGLQHLDVSSNCLTALPEGLGSLTILTFLDASNNSRVTLPASLSRLVGLRTLQLSWVWSELGPLWAAAPCLTALLCLNVIGNGVTELPPSISGFKALSHLALSMNNLASLPDEIGCLSCLVSLELSDNRLADVTPALGRLSSLASLGLRSNCLAALPEALGDLTSLTHLDASMNHIAELPDSITRLTGLHQLALSMNPLVALPAGMSALQDLKILEMYYVKLTEAVAPAGNSSSTGGDTGGTGGTGTGGGGDPHQQQQQQQAVAPTAPQRARGGNVAVDDVVAHGAVDAARRLQEQIPGLYIFSNTLPELEALQGVDGDQDQLQQAQWVDGLAGNPEAAADEAPDAAAAATAGEGTDAAAAAAEQGVGKLAYHTPSGGGGSSSSSNMRDVGAGSSSSSSSSSARRTAPTCNYRYRYLVPTLLPRNADEDAADAAAGAAAVSDDATDDDTADADSVDVYYDGDDGDDDVDGGAGRRPHEDLLQLLCSPRGAASSSSDSSSSSWTTVTSSLSPAASCSGLQRCCGSPSSHPISCTATTSGSSGNSGSSSEADQDDDDDVDVATGGEGMAAASDRATAASDLMHQGIKADTGKQHQVSSSNTSSNSTSSSSNTSSRNWCQQGRPDGGVSNSWPLSLTQLPAAAAPMAAAGSANNMLSGTWSCDLGMLAAATAAINASAAAASAAPGDGSSSATGAGSCAGGLSWGGGSRGLAAAAGRGGDSLTPLRPLTKAFSVGRSLLSRYSRGGEATGSPTISSGYGLAARMLAPAAPLQQPLPQHQEVAAAAVLPSAVLSAAADVLTDTTSSTSSSSDSNSRPARRQTRFDD